LTIWTRKQRKQPAAREKNAEYVPEKKRKKASCFPYNTPVPDSSSEHFIPALKTHERLPRSLSRTAVLLKPVQVESCD
jgi:hypothetical protein